MNTEPKTTTQVSQVTINAPIQKVWDTLDEGRRGAAFLFWDMSCTPRRWAPVRRFECEHPTENIPASSEKFWNLIHPHKYSMTFKFTDFDEPICKITHELKEVEGGTEFTLTSEEFPPERRPKRKWRKAVSSSSPA